MPRTHIEGWREMVEPSDSGPRTDSNWREVESMHSCSAITAIFVGGMPLLTQRATEFEAISARSLLIPMERTGFPENLMEWRTVASIGLDFGSNSRTGAVGSMTPRSRTFRTSFLNESPYHGRWLVTGRISVNVVDSDKGLLGDNPWL